MTARIGFVDSGIGGINVLNEVLKVLSNVEYVYYVDSINNPYGEKSEKELFEILCKITDILIEYECKLIVLACNTATTRCVKRLRNKYKNIEFIGSEPAIKKALDNDFKNILILGTTLTINSVRLQNIINENKKETQQVFLHASKTLAKSIEYFENVSIEKELENIKLIYEYHNIDCIVLGCTHYCFIKDRLMKLFPKVIVIDGNDGIARMVRDKYMEKYDVSKKGSVKFILTDESKNEDILLDMLN